MGEFARFAAVQWQQVHLTVAPLPDQSNHLAVGNECRWAGFAQRCCQLLGRIFADESNDQTVDM